MAFAPPPKRPMTAKTFRALMYSLTDAERLTFGKIVVEYLADQPNGIFDLIRVVYLNLSEEELNKVNKEIRRVKEYLSASSEQTRRELSSPYQGRIEAERLERYDDREDVRGIAITKPTRSSEDFS